VTIAGAPQDAAAKENVMPRQAIAADGESAAAVKPVLVRGSE